MPRATPQAADGRSADQVHRLPCCAASRNACCSTLNSGGVCGGSSSRAGVLNGLERAQVGAVDLVALHQLHVPQPRGGGLDRPQHVDEHPLVGLDQFGERRPVLGGVEHVRHVLEAGQRPPGVGGVKQVDGQVTDRSC